MRLAVFDLDGTLTHTTGVDDACFVQAMDDELGLRGFSTDWSRYPHVTDEGLTLGVCRQHPRDGGLGRDPSADQIARVRRRFIGLLRRAAADEPGRFTPVPGAQRVLRALAGGLDGWAVAIATGAWRESALIKLDAAGMGWAAASIPAAFAGHPAEGAAMERERIVGLATGRAAAAAGVGAFDQVVCVGDGVWDLLTARRLGHGFVGVGRGAAGERLAAAGAAVVLPDLDGGPAVLDALGAAAAP
jgi:phosphoglycolate phosphatase-like HAD superfamily hydrolase